MRHVSFWSCLIIVGLLEIPGKAQDFEPDLGDSTMIQALRLMDQQGYHAPAKLLLGLAYQEGCGVVKDEEVGFQLLKEAANGTCPEARFALIEACRKGKGVEKKCGNDLARVYEGRGAYTPGGYKRQVQEALRTHLEKPSQPSSVGLTSMAIYLLGGHEAPQQNPNTETNKLISGVFLAEKGYQDAVRRGDAEGQYDAARLLLACSKSPTDITKASTWLLSAALTGFSPAFDELRDLAKANNTSAPHYTLGFLSEYGPDILFPSLSQDQRLEQAAGHYQKAHSVEGDQGFYAAQALYKMTELSLRGHRPVFRVRNPWCTDAKDLTREDLLNNLRLAAEGGSAQALDVLGQLYESGERVPAGRDLMKAKAYYAKAHAQGCVKATYHLARWLKNHHEDDGAFALYLQAADKGHSKAQYQVAQYYKNRSAEHREDQTQAFRWFMRAARNGHPQAQLSIAQLYGCTMDQRYKTWLADNARDQPLEQHPTDPIKGSIESIHQGRSEEAFNTDAVYTDPFLFAYQIGRGVAYALHFFTQASAAGLKEAAYPLGCIQALHHKLDRYQVHQAWNRQPEAQYQLSLSYDQGLQIPQDKAMALMFLTQAAEQEHPQACYALGQLFDAGCNGIKDPVKAAMLYHTAAIQGHANAQYDLAQRYAKGQGLSVDKEMAIFWYIHAANQRHAQSPHTLASYYSSKGSLGGKQKALAWLELSAHQGHAPSHMFLARFYVTGEAEAYPRSLEATLQAWQKAPKLYRASADQGEAAAMYRLGLIHATGYGGGVADRKVALSWYAQAFNKGYELPLHTLAALANDGLSATWKKLRQGPHTLESAGDRAQIYAEGCMSFSPEPVKAAYWKAFALATQHWPSVMAAAHQAAALNTPDGAAYAAALYHQAVDEGGQAEAQRRLIEIYRRGSNGFVNRNAAVILGQRKELYQTFKRVDTLIHQIQTINPKAVTQLQKLARSIPKSYRVRKSLSADRFKASRKRHQVAYAQLRLGQLYLEGRYLMPDHHEAFNLLQKAHRYYPQQAASALNALNHYTQLPGPTYGPLEALCFSAARHALIAYGLRADAAQVEAACLLLDEAFTEGNAEALNVLEALEGYVKHLPKVLENVRNAQVKAYRSRAAAGKPQGIDGLERLHREGYAPATALLKKMVMQPGASYTPEVYESLGTIFSWNTEGLTDAEALAMYHHRVKAGDLRGIDGLERLYRKGYGPARRFLENGVPQSLNAYTAEVVEKIGDILTQGLTSSTVLKLDKVAACYKKAAELAYESVMKADCVASLNSLKRLACKTYDLRDVHEFGVRGSYDFGGPAKSRLLAVLQNHQIKHSAEVCYALGSAALGGFRDGDTDAFEFTRWLENDIDDYAVASHWFQEAARLGYSKGIEGIVSIAREGHQPSVAALQAMDPCRLICEKEYFRLGGKFFSQQDASYQDNEVAALWFFKGIEAGDDKCLYNTYCDAHDEIGRSIWYYVDNSLDKLAILAQQGCAPALALLKKYRQGAEVPAAALYRLAFHFSQPGNLQNDEKAAFCMGAMISHPENYKLTSEWLKGKDNQTFNKIVSWLKDTDPPYEGKICCQLGDVFSYDDEFYGNPFRDCDAALRWYLKAIETGEGGGFSGIADLLWEEASWPNIKFSETLRTLLAEASAKPQGAAALKLHEALGAGAKADEYAFLLYRKALIEGYDTTAHLASLAEAKNLKAVALLKDTSVVYSAEIYRALGDTLRNARTYGRLNNLNNQSLAAAWYHKAMLAGCQHSLDELIRLALEGSSAAQSILATRPLHVAAVSLEADSVFDKESTATLTWFDHALDFAHRNPERLARIDADHPEVRAVQLRLLADPKAALKPHAWVELIKSLAPKE